MVRDVWSGDVDNRGGFVGCVMPILGKWRLEGVSVASGSLVVGHGEKFLFWGVGGEGRESGGWLGMRE
jgi:hypothetical protein